MHLTVVATRQVASVRGRRMLRLSIHGRFRAEDNLGNELPIKSRKARALLAYLALPPGKPRSREALMALLWSDRGDEQARGSVRPAPTLRLRRHFRSRENDAARGEASS